MYERFNHLLKLHNITSYKVAQDTGINQAILSNWKTGRAVPGIKTLQNLAQYFDVSVDWLLGGDATPAITNIKKESMPKDIDSIIDDIDIYYYGGDKNMTEEQRKQLKRIIAATLNEDNK